EHAGHDLVAVGDADHAVEAVGLHDRLDAVGDQLAAGQGELHADVAHGDAVIDADGVEQEGDAAGLADALLDVLADGLEVDVAGDDVGVAVADGDEGLVEVAVVADLAGGPQQAAVRRPVGAPLDGVASHGVPQGRSRRDLGVRVQYTTPPADRRNRPAVRPPRGGPR